MNQDADSDGDRSSNNPSDRPHLDTLKNRMNLELESISVNQLYELATDALSKKLISAHGYRGGQYELLRKGEFILLSPQEAIQYLQKLLEEGDR